jgi:arylsulfatase A-like enzyme
VNTDQPNVVIIVLDTLRNGIVDFEHLRTNNSALFNEFIVYNNCVAAAPWTIPSHVSIFTGKYPSEHGIHEKGKKASAFSNNLELSELKFGTTFQFLKKKGYMNYGISSNINVRPGTIFERGFDVFQFLDFPYGQSEYLNLLKKINEEVNLRNIGVGLSAQREVAAEMIKKGHMRELFDLYMSWRKAEKLKKDQGYPLEKGASYIMQTLRNSSFLKPFSLFLNIMEMHEEYTTKSNPYDWYKELISHKRMNIKEIQEIRKEYTAQGERVKNFLNEFLINLKRMGEWDNTLIIITSDHGQAFWEHGFASHGTFLYDELVRVPLLIKYPNNRKGGVSDMLCSIVDIPGIVDSFSSGANSELNPSDVVFSESFGVVHEYSSIVSLGPRDQKEKLEAVLKALDFRRVSAFKGNMKITLNAENGEIIEYLENSKPTETDKKRIVEIGILDDLEIFDSRIVLPFR